MRAFPLDGGRLDRGESLSQIVPFSFSVAERKIMDHFAVNSSLQETQNNFHSPIFLKKYRPKPGLVPEPKA